MSQSITPLGSQWIRVKARDLYAKCDVESYNPYDDELPPDLKVYKDTRDSRGKPIPEEAYEQYHLGIAEANDYDIFVIHVVGYVNYKKFDAECLDQIEGQITLDQLDESEDHYIYIRKSRVACGQESSMPDIATCCANSEYDPDQTDPFF